MAVLPEVVAILQRDEVESVLSDLPRMTDVGGDLDISDNDVLTTIDGLASLTSVGGGLKFMENHELCDSIIQAFVTAMEALGWSDGTEIFDNADC